jgi:acetylornithine deacetylase/succinyl-diaminopimelate desuccinylase-like protein
MDTPLPRILSHVDATLDQARQNWFAFLRIPSISAQPAHAPDCQAAAEWAAGQLAGLGFTTMIRPTAGHPCVVAHHPGPGPEAPHLLYYGHYDVQPADPLELWHSPPFAPVLTEGPHGPRVVARGAVDDKGQVMTWLEAFRAWHAVTGSLPARITVLLEGEEETGSPNLEPFMLANRDELAADIAVISDTNMWNIDTPAITTRVRGIVYAEITLHAASRDLHSGMYGGSALNPLNALTRILGDLHDGQGRIQLPGFYDRVQPVSAEQLAAWDALGFDEAAFLSDVGLSVPVGEAGFAPLVRLWARPTADINGIWGGYTGPGGKTVIPAMAHAKVSFRLVPDQVPEEVASALRAFIDARLPADARVDVKLFSSAAAIEVPATSRFVTAARAALAAEYDRDPVLNGSGGSLPVVDSIRRVLGLDSLLLGFGLDDDQIHSPNEKFEVKCFHHGIRAHVRLLAALGRT